MHVEQLPDLNPPNFGDVIDAGRPILSFGWTRDGAHRVAAHQHPRGHIIHVLAGACWVACPEGAWLVPAGLAFWIPPHVFHEVYTQDSIAADMLFVDPANAVGLPTRCGMVAVRPLFRELIQRARALGNSYGADGRAARLAPVLLDELAEMQVSPLLLPAGRDPRLSRVMAHLIKEPGTTKEIDELARLGGASPRTLARLFRTETGMTLSQWRTRLTLLESIDRLSHGASVAQVAHDLGYQGVSSFVFMFRREMGIPPGRFVAGARGDGA